MTSNKQTDFFNVVSERHAVRHFDASLTLSEREIRDLLAIANSAPSSWNLQHWKFLLITDPAAKQKLLPIAYGQKQVIEASFVVAIPGDLQANLNAETIYESDVQAGILPESVKTKMIEQVETAYATEPNTARDEAIRNASLAAMQLMLAAKARGLDSCPMGGYDARSIYQGL